MNSRNAQFKRGESKLGLLWEPHEPFCDALLCDFRGSLRTREAFVDEPWIYKQSGTASHENQGWTRYSFMYSQVSVILAQVGGLPSRLWSPQSQMFLSPGIRHKEQEGRGVWAQLSSVPSLLGPRRLSTPRLDEIKRARRG